MSVAGYTQGVRSSPAAPVGPTAGCAQSSAASRSAGGGPPQPPPNDEQFKLTDKNSGQPLVRARYEIHDAAGLLVAGRTDENGFTARVNTGGKREQLKVFLLPEEGSVIAPWGRSEGCV